MAMIGTPLRCRNSRMVSSPSLPGMKRSHRTTSGGPSRRCRNPSSPSFASRTWYPVFSKCRRSKERNVGLSSMSRMRVMISGQSYRAEPSSGPQGNWVDDPRRPRAVLFRLVRMAVEEKVEIATLLDRFHQSLVVAVQKGDRDALQFEPAVGTVQLAADAVDRLLNAERLRVAIAE